MWLSCFTIPSWQRGCPRNSSAGSAALRHDPSTLSPYAQDLVWLLESGRILHRRSLSIPNRTLRFEMPSTIPTCDHIRQVVAFFPPRAGLSRDQIVKHSFFFFFFFRKSCPFRIQKCQTRPFRETQRSPRVWVRQWLCGRLCRTLPARQVPEKALL